jgi:hypothetical protein
VRSLVAIVVIVVVGVLVGVIAGFTSWTFAIAEVAVIVSLLALDRLATPVIDRWDRGATGEEHVGHILETLAKDGWWVVHDFNTGRGNIDHIVVGPGGVFSVETKSHGGRIAVDRVDDAMLRQAYAQAKHLEALIAHTVTPLLVFSRAYLVGRPVSRQRGVLVLPARMLADHLTRRPARLSSDQTAELQARLIAAPGAPPGV